MCEKAEYQNAIRSRNLIRKAFVELMCEKEIDKITVTNIVTRADINRGTSYAHYCDALVVLGQIEDELIQKLNEFIEECNEKDLVRNPLPILQEVGRELEENLEFYRLLMASSVSCPFLEKLRDLFVERMVNDPRAKSRYRNKAKFRVNMSFFAGGMLALYKDWFAGKIDISLEEVAQVVCELNPYATQ
jgi:AcrR family transcriptional regulator